MALDLGNLNIYLGADTRQLKLGLADASKSLDKHAKDQKSALDKMAGEFSRTFGGIAPRVQAALGQVGESIQKVFGESATGPALALGKEISKLTGISETTFSKMGEGLKALQPLFAVVAATAGLISAPLLLAVAAITSLVAAYGALRKAMPEWHSADAPSGPNTSSSAKAGWDILNKDFPTEQQTPEEGLLSKFGTAFAADFKASLGSGIEGLKEALKSAGLDVDGALGALAKVFKGGPGAKELKDAAKARTKALAAAMDADFDPFRTMKVADAAEKSIRDRDRKEGYDFGALDKKTGSGMQGFNLPAMSGLTSVSIGNSLKTALDQVAGGFMTVKEAALEFGVSLKDLDKAVKDSADLERTVNVGTRNGKGLTGASTVPVAQTGKDMGQGLLGKVGGISGDVIQGFMQGGLAGALVALAAGSKGFAQMVESLNTIVQAVSDALGRVFTAFEPLLIAVGPIIDLVLQGLSPVFDMLAQAFEPFAVLIASLVPIFGAIAPLLQILITTTLLPFLPVIWTLKASMVVLLPVIGALSWAVLKVVEGISWVWNTILDAVIWLINGIGDAVGSIPLLGGLGEAVKSFAVGVRSMQVDMEAIQLAEDSAVGLMNGSYAELAKSTQRQANAADDATDKTNKMSDAATKATEALTNVPSGYKVALARFNATLGSGQSEYLPALAEGGVITRPTVALIGEAGPEAVVPLNKASQGGGTISVTIVSNDARRLWDEIKRLAQRDNFTLNGSMVPAASPWVGK